MQKKILLIKQTVLSDCGFTNSFPKNIYFFYKKVSKNLWTNVRLVKFQQLQNLSIAKYLGL